MLHHLSHKFALTSILFFSFTVLACGGGGGAPPGGFSSTSVYITDAPIAGYSQVLVTVLSASLKNTATGSSVSVLDLTSSGGMSFDLTDLAGVLRLINVTKIPVGTYDRIVVLLANSVSLRDASGHFISAKFAPMGDTYTLEVNANITISSSATGTLILDFDLSQFNFDQVTGIVNAVLIPDDSMNDYGAYGRWDEVEGSIVSIDSANSRFTLNLEHSTINLTVLVDANTICADSNPPAVGTACLGSLSDGVRVEVKGVLDLPTGTILATIIQLPQEIHGNPGLQAEKVEGTVSSIDVSGGTFTVLVSEAEGFVPVFNANGELTVRVSQTTIWDGLNGMNSLAPQMGVEVLGTWDGTELQALKVEPKFAGDDDPIVPGPHPGNCAIVPQKSLSEYGIAPIPVFETENISLVSLSTGTDIRVSASNGEIYFIARETKLEKEPSDHICVENLSGYVGQKIEVKYVLGTSGSKIALKLEVK
ncbi:MAG: DUF5666 domain-containing protein [bacterium JZ-2024 1]